MTISNHTLVKIAAITGMATVTMGMLVRNQHYEKIRKSPYYKEAVETVKSHKGALYILGPPIKFGSVDIDKPDVNYTKDLNAKYELPIWGQKEKGTIYFWAKRNSTSEDWIVNRIELGLDKEPKRRLLVKDINEGA